MTGLNTRIVFYPSLLNAGIYGRVRSLTTGKVWNSVAMVDWVDADIATYAQPTTFRGGNAYVFTVPADLPVGDSYVTTFHVPDFVGVYAADDMKLPDEFEFFWGGLASVAPTPGEPAGHYTNKTYFDLFNGGSNKTDQIADQDDDGSADSAALQAAIDSGETWLDSLLVQIGRVAPLAGMDARTTALVRDLANRATRMFLADQFQFAAYTGRDLDEDAQKTIANIDRKFITDMIERAQETPAVLTASDLGSAAEVEGIQQLFFVPISRTFCEN
jgi:hypothetical protein